MIDFVPLIALAVFFAALAASAAAHCFTDWMRRRTSRRMVRYLEDTDPEAAK